MEKEFKGFWAVSTFNPGYGPNTSVWVDNEEKLKEVMKR